MKYLFILLLLYSGTAVGQSIPDLLHRLEHAQTDSLKIAVYQQLADHYEYTNVDSAHFYINAGIHYAQDRAYIFGEGVMVSARAELNEHHGMLDAASKQYREACELFASIGYTRGVAAATNGLGVVAGRTGKYDSATKYFLEALKLFTEIEQTNGIVQTYIKLGVVSDLLGNLDKSLEYYLKAEALNNTLPSSNASLTLLNNIGIIYGKRNDIPTALAYFHRGLRESDPKKSAVTHIALLGSLGIAYEKSGNSDSAYYFQRQALSMARESGLPEEEAHALVNLASLLSKTDPDSSLALLREALPISERIQHPSLMMDVYASMIDIHKHQNDYKQAFDLSDKRQMLKDSLFSLQKSREIAKLHAIHELAQHENEIRSLAIRNEKSVIQRNIMMVIAIVALLLIAIVWYYNTKISSLNRRLISQQGALKSSNTIKDKLFSILGHDLRAPLSRVIGLLNVLELKQTSADESMIIEKLREQSLNTLETLDNLLLWGQSQLKGIRLNPQPLNVKEQTAKSIRLTAECASQKNIYVSDALASDITVYADPIHFDFVMRNLLTNAIKFSHTGGTVTVNAFISADKQVVLSVHDSGVGIPKDLQKGIFTSGNESLRGTWNEKGTGIGLLLCREYVAENGGKLWVESEPGHGSTFYFSLSHVEHAPLPALTAEMEQ